MTIFARAAEDVSALQAGLEQLSAEADNTKDKMSGMIEPFVNLRGELEKIDLQSKEAADKLRALGVVGLKSGAPSASSMKTAADMTASEIESLARALKPVLDKIDRRQL